MVRQMSSMTADICAAVGTLALLAFLLLGTLRINNTRKARDRSRKLASRLLNWK
jgi:hypothetical protein